MTRQAGGAQSGNQRMLVTARGVTYGEAGASKTDQETGDRGRGVVDHAELSGTGAKDRHCVLGNVKPEKVGRFLLQ